MTDDVAVSLSLRNRLVSILILGAALLALVLFFGLRSYATQIAQRGQDRILSAAATAILDAAVMIDGQLEIDVPYAAFSMLSTPFDDRVFYAISQDGVAVSGYEDLPVQPSVRSHETNFQSFQYKGVQVRSVATSRTLISASGRTNVSLVLAQSQDALSGALQRISTNAALFGAGFFVLAALLSFWATATTIGQLKDLTSSVTRRGPQDLRPFLKPTPAEMAPLVGSLNSLMRRLDHSLQQSEDFIAEAAHRVRTPLATVRSHAEATLQRVDKEENRQALRAMVRAIDESSRAAGQLLDHAMITFRADHLERQKLDLVELTQDLVTRLTPLAEMKDVDLVQDGIQSLTYFGDTILLQSALRNIVDNALKYAPVETKIVISVLDEPQPTIRVVDFGPGFPDDGITDLTTRFKRGSNAQGTIGSGLGLTIAADVAIAHGGHVTLSNHAGGGACVIVSL